MSTDRDSLRAAEVRRRHRPAGRDMSGRSFWTNMTFETASWLAAAMPLLPQLFLEPAFWMRPGHWPPGTLPPFLFGRIALGLLALAPVSGALMAHFLARRTPPQTSVSVWVRGALFLGSCIPWLGFLLIPLWRRLMASPPPWIGHPRAEHLDLEAPRGRLPRASPLRRVYASGAFAFWLVATGILLPAAGCLWLAAKGSRGTILGTCIALHLVQACCLALYAESGLRFTTQPRRLLRLFPWLCLLPLPMPILAILATSWPEIEGARGKTLTWSAYARRGGLQKAPVIPPRAGQAEAVRRTWVRVKAYLLLIEAPLVIGALVRLAGDGPVPAYDPVADPSLRPWLRAISLLAALGLLQAATGALGHLLRLRLPAALGPPSAGLYLFLTQAALVFALLAGPLAAHERFRELTLFNVLSSTLAAMLTVLFLLGTKLLGSQSQSLATLAAWPVGFLTLTVPPLALALRPELAPTGLGLALLVPVVDVVLGVWRLPWLLYPFRWRDVFDREIAAGTRVRLGLRTLAAVLPLGGLALPAWLLLGEPGQHPRQRFER